jgi:hypothetical protein
MRPRLPIVARARSAALTAAAAMLSPIALPVTLAALPVALLVAAPAHAQDEGALRRAFEGRTITLRVDMPATSQGVDVFPRRDMPVDFRQVAQRLKDNGTAIKMGQPVMITKVVVKKNSHVEFQLGGGGYGTFGDWATNGTDVSATRVGESQEERDLRGAIKNASDRDEKRRLERQLSSMRGERERDNARTAAEAQQANLAREASIRSKRAEAGSRFNIRFEGGLPPEALTPEGIARALAEYADFSQVPAVAATLAAGAQAPAAAGSAGTAASAPSAGTAVALGGPKFVRTLAAGPAAASGTAAAAPSAAPAAGGIAALRKGLSLVEVEQLLGPAATASEGKDGSLTITRRTYRPDGAQVQARFVGGVLVDYAITPR